jgi:hypothetical protein
MGCATGRNVRDIFILVIPDLTRDNKRLGRVIPGQVRDDEMSGLL